MQWGHPHLVGHGRDTSAYVARKLLATGEPPPPYEGAKEQKRGGRDALHFFWLVA